MTSEQTLIIYTVTLGLIAGWGIWQLVSPRTATVLILTALLPAAAVLTLLWMAEYACC